MQEKSDGWPKVLDIYFENNDTLAYSWEEAITIEETGMYYLWFVICDEDLASATVRGQTTWKNPTGRAPHMTLTSTTPAYRSFCLHNMLPRQSALFSPLATLWWWLVGNV